MPRDCPFSFSQRRHAAPFDGEARRVLEDDGVPDMPGALLRHPAQKLGPRVKILLRPGALALVLDRLGGVRPLPCIRAALLCGGLHGLLRRADVRPRLDGEVQRHPLGDARMVRGQPHTLGISVITSFLGTSRIALDSGVLLFGRVFRWRE